MAINLNLLPEDKIVGKGASTVADFTRKITIFLSVIFLIALSGLASFFIISTVELRSLTATLDSLKSKVQQEESVEQKTYLLKDRITKIKIARGMIAKVNSREMMLAIFTALPLDSNVSDFSLDKGKTEIVTTFKNPDSFGNFIKNINTSESFSAIDILSFGYNPTEGYVADIMFKQK